MYPKSPFSKQRGHVCPLCASAVLLTVLLSNAAYATPSVIDDTTASAISVNKSATPLVADKKVISHHAYANWRSIANTVLSRDGNWAAYAMVAQEADGEIIFKNLKDGKEWRFPRGIAPAFSADGKYVAFSIRPTQAELDKAKKEKKKGEDLPKAGLGIVDLSNGNMEAIDTVKQFAWPEEGGNFLVALLEPKKEEKKEIGSNKKADIEDAYDEEAGGSDSKKKALPAELIFIDVQKNERKYFDGVMNFTWAKNGSFLAFSVRKPLKDVNAKPVPIKEILPDGIHIFHPQNAQAQTILSGAGSYKQLKFNDAGTMLAFVSNRDEIAKIKEKKLQNEKLLAVKKTSEKVSTDEKKSDQSKEKNTEKDANQNLDKEAPIYQLFSWNPGQDAAQLLASAETKGMPASWGVSEFGSLNFSKDGQRLFFSTAVLPKPETKDDEELVKVDLWHWQDPELQSVQKVNAEKDKNKHFKAVIHLADQRFVQLATPLIPSIAFNDNAEFALGTSDVPYKMLSSWDGNFEDAYAIDLKTGVSSLLAKKLRFSASLSPAGKYVLAFDAASSQWLAWNTLDAKAIELTKKIKVNFEDHEHDTPEPRSAYGVAGWTSNDQTVVIYDQYDLWEINPQTLEHKNLSNGYGRRHQLELRYVPLGEDTLEKSEEVTLSAERKALPSHSWVLSATHEQNRSSGFFQQDPHGGTPQQLMLQNKMLGSVIKAKQADDILFTQQSFTEFPDLWHSNLQFQHPEKISAANPQQVKYNWGTQELIEYTTKDGKKLKALLAKPENFDPAKKYPLMVYIYEKMTDNLYRYVPPAPSQNINVTRYVSNGYVVLRPDIVYQTGHPGKSAMNAVIPAINKVVGLGYVDAKRIGIQGHSWGAYQINYMLTQTNMFRAAEAGAAVGDMVSGYGGIRWGKGVSRAFQYETGQSRIGGTPWSKTNEYIENSAIFHIDKIQTPYLTKHNDGDDAVPWYQAIEFFTAMRRLGKEAYWFNYNGEKHGLKDRENIKHYTVHLDEYFDHFLLNQSRPDWMNAPIPYLQRGKRDVKPLFTPEDVMTVPVSSSKKEM
ncbi:S9 family peptidase [Undibacterium jejuense]|uniref:S9 family peptidase n=1 Tax=Undibacterium jejuense TaxID=1344949 RepID=A0A923HG54_9BURK|nr:S9 family peptidase [Undibacterium jejuense]